MDDLSSETIRSLLTSLFSSQMVDLVRFGSQRILVHYQRPLLVRCKGLDQQIDDLLRRLSHGRMES